MAIYLIGFYFFVPRVCLTLLNTVINSEQQPTFLNLTYNFAARVLGCDGNSACGTLTALLKPELDTACAEHMVVPADHRLTDLRTRDETEGQCGHGTDRMCSVT